MTDNFEIICGLIGGKVKDKVCSMNQEDLFHSEIMRRYVDNGGEVIGVPVTFMSKEDIKAEWRNHDIKNPEDFFNKIKKLDIRDMNEIAEDMASTYVEYGGYWDSLWAHFEVYNLR
jgi:hypothetical protein